MKKNHANSLFNTLFILGCGVLMGFGYLLFDSWNSAENKLANLKRKYDEAKTQETAAEQRGENVETHINLIKNNPEFFWNEVRQRLNYAAPGEIVIRVEPGPNSAK